MFDWHSNRVRRRGLFSLSHWGLTAWYNTVPPRCKYTHKKKRDRKQPPYSISQSAGDRQSRQSGKAHTPTPSHLRNNFRAITLNALQSSHTSCDREGERGGRDGLKVSKRAWREFRNVLKELNIDDSVDNNVFLCTSIFFFFYIIIKIKGSWRFSWLTLIFL